MENLHPSMREVAVLQAASEMILSSMEAETVLHQILLIVRNYFEISHCAVLLVDVPQQELYCSAQIGYDGLTAQTRRLKINLEGICGYVAAKRVPTYLPDVTKDHRYIALDRRVQCQLCIPLIVRDECVGVLNLESDQLDFFSDEMIGLLALFASQAAVALDNARLYTSERKRMRQIEFVNLIARSSATASNLDQLLTTFSELLTDTFEDSSATILLRNNYGHFETSQGSSLDPEMIASSVHDGLIREAMDARSSVLASSPEQTIVSGSLSELATPLISIGETLGVILLSSPRPNAFNADDRSVAQTTADVCATAIRNVQLSEELRRVTNTDPLTGLFNQRYLHFTVGQELSRAKRFGKDFAILGLDLRDFRKVNAEFGFSKGDELLRRCAAGLRTAFRAVDTVCRHDADTFIVVLPEISGEQAKTVAQKMIAAVERAQQETIGRHTGVHQATVAFPIDGDTELKLLRALLHKLSESAEKTSGAATGH
jgi:diguanylate cyclase (GGDEF)-like protein